MNVLTSLIVTASFWLVTVKGNCHDDHAVWNQMPGKPEPQCKEDGTYQNVQCVGSGCLCVDADGEWLTPNDFFTNFPEGANMDCNCARDQHEYQSLGIVGKVFTCDSKGSYEKRQCYTGVCYCVDENGQQVGNEVAIADMETLTCN